MGHWVPPHCFSPKRAICFFEFYRSTTGQATVTEPLFIVPQNTKPRSVWGEGALKISAVLKDIESNERKRNNRRKYGNCQCPIDMLFRTTADHQNRRKGFETDFSHLAHRPASRLIDCAVEA
jgi:hypothetical protein